MDTERMKGNFYRVVEACTDPVILGIAAGVVLVKMIL